MKQKKFSSNTATNAHISTSSLNKESSEIDFKDVTHLSIFCNSLTDKHYFRISNGILNLANNAYKEKNVCASYQFDQNGMKLKCA